MNFNTQIIVGNSPSLLDHEYGEFIDSFPTVVRFNGYKIFGYEKHVGSKTDILTFFEVRKPDTSDYKKIYCVGRKGCFGKAKRFANSVGKEIVFVIGNDYVKQLYKICGTKRFICTSGIRFLIYAIETLRWTPTVIGFDGYSSNTFNYHRYRKTKVSDKYKESGKFHLQILEYYEKENRIKWIKL